MRLVRPDGRAFAFEITVQGLCQEFESGGARLKMWGARLKLWGAKASDPYYCSFKTTCFAKVWRGGGHGHPGLPVAQALL